MRSRKSSHRLLDYVNEDTCEVIPGYWSPIPERSFFKHESDSLIKTLSSSIDKAMNVLGYLMVHMHAANNTVKTSYTTIAKDMKLARSTVILALTTLQENDNVRMVQYGLWMVNPRLHSKGYESKTLKLIAEYDKLETLANKRLKNKERTDEKND